MKNRTKNQSFDSLVELYVKTRHYYSNSKLGVPFNRDYAIMDILESLGDIILKF